MTPKEIKNITEKFGLSPGKSSGYLDVKLRRIRKTATVDLYFKMRYNDDLFIMADAGRSWTLRFRFDESMEENLGQFLCNSFEHLIELIDCKDFYIEEIKYRKDKDSEEELIDESMCQSKKDC